VNARNPFVACLTLGLLCLGLLAPTTAEAVFEIKSLSAAAVNEDGTAALQAGSHPYVYTVSFDLNTDSDGVEQRLRNLIIDLPPGFVGNPLAVPRCSGSAFEGAGPRCPGNTQVGVVSVRTFGVPIPRVPVYNLVPPLGVPASIGFSLFGTNSFQEASIRTGRDYGATVSDLTLPTSRVIESVTETIWGTPAQAGHDAERECVEPGGGLFKGCPSDSFPAPFLTLPTSCGAPLETTVRADSMQEPGVYRERGVFSLDEAGNPAGLRGCERPPFEPKITARPETAAADSATGLHVNLHLPQSNDSDGIATAHLRDTVLTLPQGMAVNPSAADGLAACGSAQIDLNGPGPAQCPAASKLGTVSIESPLVDHPLPGAIYLAKQGENPFGSLLALYLAVEDPLTGVVVKLAGKVEPDPLTGQLRTTFVDNPQLPFEDLDVELDGGPRAALTTPLTCGVHTTTTELTPWTTPAGADAFPADSFPISSAPDGSVCAPSEALAPFNPSFEAGTVSPLAGSYSPFVLKMSRENGSQRFAAVGVTLPPGLTGKLAGLSECSEAQIAAAAALSSPGQGVLERGSPSCPQSSQVGTVNVGAGSGSPLYVQGHAYLAGPYKGAPLSLAIITPAVAGPFDLGVVVVRSALHVDQTTAQITVESDPIPTILQGIPLDIRSIAVNVDRDTFTLNPTNCEEAQVSGRATSTSGQGALLSNRFQVGGCKGLDFTPKLSLRFSGKTKRTGNPALKAVLTQPPGQAGIRRAVVILPRSEFIDNRHINNPCTRVQFNAGAGKGAECPPSSILGTARAFSPLLDRPLEGPVYFRSNGGERELPDLVASLDGKVHLNVVGFVDSIRTKGSEGSRLRNTFATVPDAPVSRFVLELAGGKKGLLQNSTDICKVTNVATARFSAQNGKVALLRPQIATGCKKREGGRAGR
jgi:hypothetical protein